MIGIDLFSGAGGMSLGASQAGIDIKLSVELDPFAAWTYEHNHKNVAVFNDDIRKLKKINVRKNSQGSIVFGGPPCQGFSTSNQKTRNSQNTKNWLFKEYVRIVKKWMPDWIVMENVQGMKDMENGLFLEKILGCFGRIGYTLSSKVLNAADFGVPQKRSRLFIVGSLHGIKFKFPQPKFQRGLTVYDAIADLPKIRNGNLTDKLEYRSESKSAYAKQMRRNRKFAINNLVTNNSLHVIERYKHIPQGGNWQNIPSRLMKNYKDRSRCHTGIYYRLKRDEPSVVIGNYRKNMLIHPTQDRGLSVREAARLQSFPDWYEFKGSIGFQQQQVGNAVPPKMAKAVFDEIRSNCIN